MSKKLFLVLSIPPLVYFISYLLVFNFPPGISGESLATFMYSCLYFGKALLFYLIEILALFLIRKLLSKKLNDYQLVSIIFIISFIILLVIGGFDGFLINMAYSTKNLSLCNMINHVSTKNTCILFIALKTQNEFICENLPSGMTKDACYSNVAKKAKKLDVCEKILDPIFKEDCYEYAK